MMRGLATAYSSNGYRGVFGIEKDNSVVWTTTGDGSSFSPVSSLGGAVKSVTPVTDAQGNFHLFAAGYDDSAWVNSQQGKGWSGWQNLGGKVVKIAAVTHADGRFVLFAIGTDHCTYAKMGYGAGKVSDWITLGGRAMTEENGRLGGICADVTPIGGGAVYVIGEDHQIWRRNQDKPDGPLGDWECLGGWIAEISAGDSTDGRMELFGIGKDSAVWRIEQEKSGKFGGWVSNGGQVKTIHATVCPDKSNCVAAVGSDNSVYVLSQQGPGGPYNNWAAVGGVAQEVLVWPNTAQSGVTVFARGGDEQLYVNHVVAPAAGKATGWAKVG